MTLLDNEFTLDANALAAWMDSIGLEQAPVKNIQQLAGGTQNILMRFNRGERDFILCRPPEHLRSNSNKIVRRETHVLEALKGSEVPHPRFDAVCEDESIIGTVFCLMAPVEGFNPANELPELHAGDESIRRRMGFSYIEGLAQLGAIDYKAVGLEGFGRPEGYVSRQTERWMSELESHGAFDNWTGFADLPDVERIVSWFNDNPPTEFQPGTMRGDCHLANCMFEPNGPELAAFVDRELSNIGDPLIDVGWVIATWEDSEDFGEVGIKPLDGFPGLSELISHYGARTSRNMDAIGWCGVLACFKLGAILEGTHAQAGAGMAPKPVGTACMP